jgi:hypothetical protein
MKTIQPKQIYYNGQMKSAVYFSLFSTYDNLNTYADFRYYLLDENQETIYAEQIKMEGTAYDNWTDNNYAYNWAASPEVLDLVITGDYIYPNV